METIKSIKRQTDLFSLASMNTVLHRVASTGGGEWAGPCPFPNCSCKKDGFRVQPYSTEGGKWFCRGCGEGRWHDVIDYIIWRDHCQLSQAINKLSNLPIKKEITVKKEHAEEFIDRAMWDIAAQAFYVECKENLFKEEGCNALDWLKKRELKEEIIKGWDLGYNQADRYELSTKWGISDGNKNIFLPRGITIPNKDRIGLHALKVRRPCNDKGKYMLIKGSHIWLYGDPSCKGVDTAFLFESELDALLGMQSNLKVGCLALPAGQHLKSAYQYILSKLRNVIIIPDNDGIGYKHAKTIAIFPGFHLGEVPSTGKDLSEYAQNGGDISAYLSKSLVSLEAGEI
jgi:DNA primase